MGGFPTRRPSGADVLDKKVLGGFLAEDEAAVARVHRRVAAVVGFKGYYIPVDERADVVQQVMLELWQTLKAPDHVCRSFDALMRTIAHRRCVDWMRRHRPMGVVDVDSLTTADRPDHDFLDKERRLLARRVLEALREPCRELIRLLAVVGLSYREIGERQNRSPGALRVQFCKCLKEARSLLGRLTSEGACGGTA